jgi:hypothetical protein
MFKEVFDHKNQKRRTCSMLKNSFGIKYFLAALAFLLIIPAFAPMKAWAGDLLDATVTDTDLGDGSTLFFFWDLRGRESFFQVTNTENKPVTVHVQVFNTATGCSEFDFFDTYTGDDTHLYNVRHLDSNNGALTGPPPLDNGYGFIVVSTFSDTDHGLTGSFRIVDATGYEYRTNAADFEDFDDIAQGETLATGFYTFNFNDINGISLADVVGIVVDESTIDSGTITEASAPTVTFTPTLVNEAENPFSCPPAVFACATDYGINQAILNSKGGTSICGDTNTNGAVGLDLSGESSNARFVVGFIGLNDGAGHGSMDAWWANGTNIVPVGVTSPNSGD